MSEYTSLSPETLSNQPDSVEQYTVDNGYREGRLFTEQGKKVDIKEAFKPGEVALVQEKIDDKEQPNVYIVLNGVAISVMDSLAQENGGIIAKELDHSDVDANLTIGDTLPFGRGGSVDRVLLSGTAIHGGDPKSTEADPVSYFANALIKHRRDAGRGDDLGDHRTKSGQALIALESYI
jgi:hypothetical protein